MPEEAAVLAPKEARFLSNSVLKLIALIAMIVDHVTKRILVAYPEYMAPIAGIGVSVCEIGESIGRLAFPIYCFLLVEGFCYTHDRKRYGLSLLTATGMPVSLLAGAKVVSSIHPLYTTPKPPSPSREI